MTRVASANEKKLTFLTVQREIFAISRRNEIEICFAQKKFLSFAFILLPHESCRGDAARLYSDIRLYIVIRDILRGCRSENYPCGYPIDNNHMRALIAAQSRDEIDTRCRTRRTSIPEPPQSTTSLSRFAFAASLSTYGDTYGIITPLRMLRHLRRRIHTDNNVGI